MTTTKTFDRIDQPQSVALAPRTLLVIDDRRGGTLRIEHGEAWVTFGDGTPDHLMHAGDTLPLGTMDKTLVSPLPCAQGAVVVGIEPAQARARFATLQSMLRAWAMPQAQA